MAACDSILKNGVFDTIIIDTTKSISESYVEWLKVATFQQIKEKSTLGLKIGFPIEGVPLEFKSDITEDEFNEWKQAIDQGKVRTLDAIETQKLVSQSVSEVLVEAWSDCIETNAFGLLDYEDIGTDGSFSVMFRYSPNSPQDGPPKVTGFVTQNATCSNPPSVGSEIPFAGFTSLFSRQKNAQGFFPEAIYVLNTEKGTADGIIPALGKPVTPKIRAIRVFSGSGSVASWPSAEVEVPAGYKLIGGGARVNWSGEGNLLTSSYPVAFNRWRGTGKDHQKSSPANIDVWAIAIEDPEDEWEVVIDQANSEIRAHPQRSLSARSGFQMVGGGARANWNSRGQLLTASWPVGKDAWDGRSKDHLESEPNTITVFCIAMRPRNDSPSVTLQIREVTTDVQQHPQGVCPAPDGCRLVGGGARVNWSGVGNLLTASYPDGNVWVAKAKDHRQPDPASITIYSIGIPEYFFK